MATALVVLAILAIAAAAAVFVAWVAPDRPASPDDALYASLATRWLAGEPLTSMDGSPAAVRAPGYPLVLAVVIAVTGDWTDAERIIGALSIGLVVLLAAGISWRTGGRVAALVAAILVALPEVILAAGRSAIDGLETTLVLAAIAVALWATRRQHVWPGAIGAGVVLGGAILVKESALIFVPLWLLWAMPLGAPRLTTAMQAALAGTAATLATIAPWWVWVYMETGRFFPAQTTGRVATIGIVVLIGSIVVLAALAIEPASRLVARAFLRVRPSIRWGIAVGLSIAWAAAMVVAFLASDPRFGLTSRPSVTALVDQVDRLAPLMSIPIAATAALVAALVYGVREVVGLRGTALATTLSLGLVGMVVLKGWDPRSAVITAVLSSIVLASLVGRGRRGLVAGRPRLVRATVDSGLAVLLVGILGSSVLGLAMIWRHPQASGPVQDWGGRIVREASVWLEANTERGDTIVSSWLFAAGMDSFTGGRLTIDQMPTLQLRIGKASEPALVPTGTLFRDHASMPSSPPTDWLFVRRHPTDDYYVGLSESLLVDEIGSSGARYLIVTGEHFAQGMTDVASAVSAWDGLREVARWHDGDATIVVFDVSDAGVAPVGEPLQMSTRTLRFWPLDVKRARPKSDPGDVLLEVANGREIEVAPDDPAGWDLLYGMLGSE